MQFNDTELQVIRDWKKAHKLTVKDTGLLFEAYRRYHMFHKGESFKQAWVGFGSPSMYRSEYFRCYSAPTPRIDHWWLLTDKGIIVIEDLISKLRWNYDYTHMLFEGVSI